MNWKTYLDEASQTSTKHRSVVILRGKHLENAYVRIEGTSQRLESRIYLVPLISRILLVSNIRRLLTGP